MGQQKFPWIGKAVYMQATWGTYRDFWPFMTASQHRLLRRLKRELDEDYIKFYGSARYIENESQLLWLAPFAIMVSLHFPAFDTWILGFNFLGCISPDPTTVVCPERKANSHRLQQAQREPPRK